MALALLPLALSSSNGLARTPAMGWNSWNWIGVSGTTDRCKSDPYRCHSEKTFRDMTDAVVSSGLGEAGYEYINLSEGWPAQCYREKKCPGRDANGTLVADPDRYPSLDH